MNIKEFAKLCGVSPATVSRYFSGTAPTSPEISEIISRAASETGYHPSPKYQRRKPGGNGLIIAVISYWHHAFQFDLVHELQSYCEELGKKLVVMCSEEEKMEQLIPLIREISPEGVVLLHEGSDTIFYDALSDSRIPMVMCSAASLTRKVSSIHIDDITAAYDGTNYLLGLGHRDIVVISDEAEAISSGSQRIMGCKKAMADAGLVLRDEAIAYAGNSFSDGYYGMEVLLKRNIPMTAVFVFNDGMAAGVCSALRDKGYRVPDDISVLGFDGSSSSLEVRPRLSTVGQPVEQITHRSLDKLLSPHKNETESIVLGHTLIPRDSCRPL